MKPPPSPDRLAREAAALRENLRRRKVQARQKQSEADPKASAPARPAGLTEKPPGS